METTTRQEEETWELTDGTGGRCTAARHGRRRQNGTSRVTIEAKEQTGSLTRGLLAAATTREESYEA